MKRTIIIGSFATIILLGVGSFAVVKQLNKKDNEPAVVSQQSAQANTESATYKQYAAMTGEMFDRNFIANMIAHHQGAVDMAKLAQTNAKHTELKEMADAIVADQNKEIAAMLAWQEQWGYPSTSSTDMQDHSAMGMMDDMDGMTQALRGKSGDDFDRSFISLMIEHHQSAIDMAQPGASNAQREEVRQLTKDIVSAQTKEIKQMRQWQNDWGYSQ